MFAAAARARIASLSKTSNNADNTTSVQKHLNAGTQTAPLAKSDFEKALALWNANDFSAAALAFKKILQSNPKNIPANFYYADSEQHQGDAGTAAEYYLHAIELGSSTAEGVRAKEALQAIAQNAKWIGASGSLEISPLYGDASLPGAYGVLRRWYPGFLAKPHFHDQTMSEYVISGTLWTGSGATYSEQTTVPVHAGGFYSTPAGRFITKVHVTGRVSR